MEKLMCELLADIALFAGSADDCEERESIILNRAKRLEYLARAYPTRYRDFRWRLEAGKPPIKSDVDLNNSLFKD